MKQDAIVFPAALMMEGVKLAKSKMNNQLLIALLWADAILADFDGVELIKACFIEAGFTARNARGTTTNASKFVAPALMVRDGEMTEKAFFALKTQEARDAFKWAGGMKGNGLDPTAWNEARSERGTNWDELIQDENETMVLHAKQLRRRGYREVSRRSRQGIRYHWQRGR